MFLLLGIFSLRTCRYLIKHAGKYPDLVWLKHLGSMLQVSLIGYAVTGAALGLAYFDFYYALVAIIVVSKVLLEKELSARMVSEEVTNRPAAPPMRRRNLKPTS
jgi:hypothetical protein